jgi:hypothetical protein
VAGPLDRRRVDRPAAGEVLPVVNLLLVYVDSIGSFSVVYVLVVEQKITYFMLKKDGLFEEK